MNIVEIPGHPGYFVSDTGRVFSEWSVGRRPTRISAQRKELHGSRTPEGRKAVALGRGSGPHLVHRLVALAFIGPCPVGQEVRHLNGNCADNQLSNLAYGTRLENMADSVRLRAHAFGVRHALAKLTDQAVLEIRRRRAAGESLSALCRAFGISAPTVCDIMARRTWKHVA